MNNLFAGLISFKTRIKLLVRFFFNPGTKAYLRKLSKEFNVSTNAVREELNQLTKTNLLTWEKEGRREFISYARQNKKDRLLSKFWKKPRETKPHKFLAGNGHFLAFQA